MLNTGVSSTGVMVFVHLKRWYHQLRVSVHVEARVDVRVETRHTSKKTKPSYKAVTTLIY